MRNLCTEGIGEEKNILQFGYLFKLFGMFRNEAV